MELDYVKLKEIKPALSGYIRESQSLLRIHAIPDDNVVHDVRVLMKKARAVLKLASRQLGKESYDRDYNTFREVGRIMRLWRENSVHRKTLKELRKENPGIFSNLQDNGKIAALLRKAGPVQEQLSSMEPDLLRIADLLKRASYRIRFQTMNKLDPQVLIQELEKTYASVVDIYLTCRNSPKPGNLHEFRKKAKDFLYQLYFFRPLNPSVIKTLEKKLESMTQNLGKFNDLTQLVITLGYKYPDKTNIPAMDELIVRIREKQDTYLARVWPLAYKIFCPGQVLVNVLGFKLLII